MKSFVSITLFILIGLLTSLVTGFGSDLFTGQSAYDEVQTGLRDRIIIRFNYVVAENTPKGLAAEKFAELAKAKTHGRVEVQVFPNGNLYSDNDEFQALMNNDVQMIAPAFSKLSNLVPQWLALDLPFAFLHQQEIEQAFQGDIGRMLYTTLEPYNMHGLAFWGNGFKQMTSSQKPLLLPQDFQGQRFRIMPSKVLESQFQALGASTETIPFNEVYRNLASGNVDGQENTISNIYSKRLYESQKYLTLSNHGYLGYCVIVNKTFWENLPEDIREELAEAMQETTIWANRMAVTMNEQQLKLLKQNPTIHISYLTAKEREEWVKHFDGVYQTYESVIGSNLMKKIMEIHK